MKLAAHQELHPGRVSTAGADGEKSVVDYARRPSLSAMEIPKTKRLMARKTGDVDAAGEVGRIIIPTCRSLVLLSGRDKLGLAHWPKIKIAKAANIVSAKNGVLGLKSAITVGATIGVLGNRAKNANLAALASRLAAYAFGQRPNPPVLGLPRYNIKFLLRPVQRAPCDLGSFRLLLDQTGGLWPFL